MAGLALGAQGTANATALFVLGALMFTPVRPRCRLRVPLSLSGPVSCRATASPARHWLAAAAAPQAGINPAHALSGVSRSQGAYYSFLAFKAWRKADGFSFDALPEL